MRQTRRWCQSVGRDENLYDKKKNNRYLAMKREWVRIIFWNRWWLCCMELSTFHRRMHSLQIRVEWNLKREENILNECTIHYFDDGNYDDRCPFSDVDVAPLGSNGEHDYLVESIVEQDVSDERTPCLVHLYGYSIAGDITDPDKHISSQFVWRSREWRIRPDGLDWKKTELRMEPVILVNSIWQKCNLKSWSLKKVK